MAGSEKRWRSHPVISTVGVGSKGPTPNKSFSLLMLARSSRIDGSLIQIQFSTAGPIIKDRDPMDLRGKVDPVIHTFGPGLRAKTPNQAKMRGFHSLRTYQAPTNRRGCMLCQPTNHHTFPTQILLCVPDLIAFELF